MAATQEITAAGAKPLAKKPINLTPEAVARTAEDATEYEVVHEMVGPHARGEVVKAEAWKEAGVDVGRLISLGAVKAVSF